MWILKDINQNNRNKNIKYIIIFLFIVIWIIYYYLYQNKSPVEVFKSATVWQKTIYSTLSSDGKVYYKEQYELNFQTTGTLSKIYKKEWDEVKKWEKVAKLDDTYLQINLDKANIAFQNAKANLNAKLATKPQKTDINISEEQLKSAQITLNTNIKQWKIDIENAQNNLDSIMISFNNAKITSEKDIENVYQNLISKEKDLEIAKSNLETITSTENLNIQNIIEKTKIEIESSIPLFEKYLRDIDLIVGVSKQNQSLNDSYEIYLWAKDTSTKYIAENSYRNSYSLLDMFIVDWNWYNYEKDIMPYLDNILSVISNIDYSLESTSNMLKNSISNSNFTQNIIDTYILNIETDINWLNSQKQKIVLDNQAIKSSKLSLETKIVNQNNNISLLELQIDQSKIALDKINIQSKSLLDDWEQKYSLAKNTLSWSIIKLQNNIDASTAQINISKAILDNKISLFDTRELEPYYVAINNAKKWIDEAQKRLWDATLISPIDWIIAKLNIQKIWTNIPINSINPFVIIINKNSLYIKAKIEEWDIWKIFLNQNVKITFNSVDNLELYWKVNFISDKSETDNNWIVSYDVEILFDTINPKIKEWFTSQIYFILLKAENVLSLPIESIKSENNISTVILKDKTVKPIKLWINDGDFVQVLEWLNVWDIVMY